jgi:hypothetical protein
MADLTSAFPPHVLREYALIADGERGALCGPRGDICWLCAPAWQSDAVCSSLLGGEGVYAVTPCDAFVWGGHYEPGSLIWRNRWVTNDGIIECRDALATPGHAEHLTLLRQVWACEGTARVRVVLDLRGGFGRRSMRDLRRHPDGTWTARTGDLRIRWTGAGAAREVEGGGLEFELEVDEGQHHDLILEISSHPFDQETRPASNVWLATETWWKDAVPQFDQTIAARDARHAYAVLRGLTRNGGGMVAAATLGLPERAEAGRNYDYRYAWLRDQAIAAIASSVDAPTTLLDDAVAFATARILEHGDQLAPAYTLEGGDLPEETPLGPPGYPGGKPISGNWVHGQFQLDSIGEMLQLFALAASYDRLESDGRQALRSLVQIVEKRWLDEEAGIWELDNAWWTQSRLACVAGLRNAAGQLAAADAGRVSSLADTILAETSKRCLHVDGYWQRSPKHLGTDASLLVPPVRGAMAVDDPRTVATYHQVQSVLADDGYVYRFAPDDRPLGAAEGAFVLCGFWMALAAWHQGDRVAAFRWFERNRAACGPPGLLAEEYDVRQRQLRGNLPQAFAHAGLLECAIRLAH